MFTHHGTYQSPDRPAPRYILATVQQWSDRYLWNISSIISINLLTGRSLQTYGVSVPRCPPVRALQVVASSWLFSHRTMRDRRLHLCGFCQQYQGKACVHLGLSTNIILYNHCSFPHDKIILDLSSTQYRWQSHKAEIYWYQYNTIHVVAIMYNTLYNPSWYDCI